MAGFESLGQLIAGSPGLAGEEGRLEGLDFGSRIRARQASTESALQLARQRRDENVAKAKLSELFADDPELAGLFQSGIDPRQLSGFRGDEQVGGFRDVISDVELPFGERQAAAQAIEGKPLSASDFLGPGGELFTDIFAEPSLEGLQATPTGEAQIEFDIQRAKLAEERRLHPDRFKAITKLSLGDELSEEILPGGKGTSIIPEQFNAEEGFGAEAFFKGGVNALSDFIGLGTQFPDEAQANAVLGELSARIQIALRADVFRPNVQIQGLLARYAEDPRQLFRGDDLGKQNLTTTLASLKRSLQRVKDQLNSPSKKTPTRLGRLEQGLFALADTTADLEKVLESLNKTSGEPEIATAQTVEIANAQIGDRIQLPGGGTATRIE